MTKKTKMEYIYFNKQNIDDSILWQQGNGHDREHPYANFMDKNEDKRIAPSLILVGDSGVYFMNHSKKSNKKKDDKGNVVVYCEECNPSIHEDAWERKREIFGGDDGVSPIPISWFTQARLLRKDLTNKSLFYKMGISETQLKMCGITKKT